MSDFVVYGVPRSPYLRSVLATLEEKRATWRLVALAPGDSKQPPHLERHPFGRIPVLDHGDFRLYETQAILRYLDRLLPEPRLTPSDPRIEARMNQVIGINDWYVFPDIGVGISFGRLVAPRLGLPPDEARIAASIPRARVCFDELGRLLAGRDFLAGDTLSLADLMVAPHLAFFALTAESGPLLNAHPALAAWLARMQERPSMRATEAARLSA